MRNEANQWDSDKIGLHVSIKEKENEIKLKVPNLILNSFILQPPPGFISTGIDGWHREDDPKREIPLDQYAEARNVYEMQIGGNRTGSISYIDRIVTKILA